MKAEGWRWPVLAGLVVWAAAAGLWSAEAASHSRDTLVYKDGDRVQGALVSDAGGTLVFKSERFGELRVPATEAVIIKAEKPAALTAVASAAPPAAERPATASEKEEAERVSLWDLFSPAVLTARVRNYFGPWHGRLSFSSEFVSDFADRNNSSYEANLKRKWKVDEVQLNARYDYNQTDSVTTTDLMKLSGLWRHDFSARFFGQYRPSSEWNRATTLRGAPNDYLLLQQELGGGCQVLATPSRKLRVGVSQNLFDTWSTVGPRMHTVSRGVVSAFEEAELVLPWRITIAQRGVWYPVNAQADGWENRLDLSKKLTETLSTSLRHEVRRNNPDGSSQDYTRLKLLFGLDF
ncbi:MAG: DUF481 domain-containing protein [Opitutaceae bacterium]